MLKPKTLDDKNYYQILEDAMNRLPTLCPSWTNYNSSDPGITLIELFSWYVEMQRFHLDQMSDEIYIKMLSLLGVSLKQAKAASLRVDMSKAKGLWPKGAVLHTKEGIDFELSDTIEIDKLAIKDVYLSGSTRDIKVYDLLKRTDGCITPFSYNGEKTDFIIELSDIDSDKLTLWFNIDQGDRCIRNSFGKEEYLPRIIKWYFNDKEITPVNDETHCLSIDGEIVFPVKPCNKGILKAELVYEGCEETVRIRSVRCNLCKAKQQTTWSKLFLDTVDSDDIIEKKLIYAPAIYGTITVFVRTKKGWIQPADATEEATNYGKILYINTKNAVNDGKENLMIICTAEDKLSYTLFNSNGLANQDLSLSLEDKIPVGNMLLLCDTKDKDGKIRPKLWSQVEDLNTCGPDDLVFVYDLIREKIIFGDGLHGAIVPKGDNAILVANLAVSLCDKGNIPSGNSLFYEENIEGLRCSTATGGRKKETCEEACIRFLKEFNDNNKCVTKEDYGRIAMKTPGLRVERAKALPGFDPNIPNGYTPKPVVSVVVVPYSQKKYPMPDNKFIEAINKQLQKYRPICTKIYVIPPKYIPIDVDLRLRCDKSINKDIIEEVLNIWCSNKDIGETLSKNDLTICFSKIGGINKIDNIKLYTTEPNCHTNSLGDIILPKNGIASIGKVNIAIF